MVGGLAGSNVGTITGSHATGDTTGGSSFFEWRSSNQLGLRDAGHRAMVGGLVGYNSGDITTSHAIGDTAGGSSMVGGLVGYSTGSASASYAKGNVTATGAVGGLIGRLGGYYSSRNANSVSYSYAIGNASGTNHVGGLIGRRYRGPVTESYAVGKVGGTSHVGGLFGGGGGSIRSFWDAQATGIAGGKTTREMQRPTGPTGIYADWDPEYWDFGTSRQYPVLKYDGMDVGAQR